SWLVWLSHFCNCLLMDSIEESQVISDGHLFRQIGPNYLIGHPISVIELIFTKFLFRDKGYL
ncbi:MAG: hypothetical protein AABY40_02625, partial [Nanoarchaeota archaeon]